MYTTERIMKYLKTAGVFLATAALVAAVACTNDEAPAEAQSPTAETTAAMAKPHTTTTTKAAPASQTEPEATAKATQTVSEPTAEETITRRPMATEPTTSTQEPAPAHNQTPVKMAETLKTDPETDIIPFRERLSPADQNCLPEHANTEDDIITLMNQGNRDKTTKLMQCLTSEGKFDLYVAQARYAGQDLSEAEHRCIWDGIRHIMVQTESETMEENKFSRIMAAMIIGSAAVTIHCAGVEALGDLPTDPAEQANLTQLACLIDQTGGPAPFIKRLLNDDNAIEQMTRESAATCGPTPAP